MPDLTKQQPSTSSQYWQEHPEWRHRYDFMTATPPAWGVSYQTRGVRYLAQPLPAGLQQAPYYFEEFYWGGSERTTRAELKRAFATVLALWDDAVDLYLTLAPLGFRYTRQRAQAPSALIRVLAQVTWYMSTVDRVARLVGRELAVLADLERAHAAPRSWNRFPAAVALGPALLAAKPPLPPSGPRDDFVFRLCRLFGSRPGFSRGMDATTAAAWQAIDTLNAMSAGRNRKKLQDRYRSADTRRSEKLSQAHGLKKNLLTLLDKPIAPDMLRTWWPFKDGDPLAEDDTASCPSAPPSRSPCPAP